MPAPTLSAWAPRTDVQWATAISAARRATLASASMFWIGLVVFGMQASLGMMGHITTLGPIALAAAGFIEGAIGFAWYTGSASGGWVSPRDKVGMAKAPSSLLQNVMREVERASSDPVVVAAAQRIPDAGQLYRADMLDLLAALQTYRFETEDRAELLAFRSAVRGITETGRGASSAAA